MGKFDVVKKGATFVVKHRKEFKKAADVVFDMKKKKEKKETEKRYYEAVEEDLMILKEDFEKQVQDLNNKIQQITESQATYQKKSTFQILANRYLGRNWNSRFYDTCYFALKINIKSRADICPHGFF